MKLVTAKCPNCGAQIDVDKDSDTTKCEYCKSKIIVDDAIAKYKVEISGKVEVSNLPKIENYLKLAERHYNDKEYKEAFEQYEKACELDPENYIAVLRRGLSKSYSTGYGNFDLKSAINGTKNAYEILNKNNADKDKINSCIVECYGLILIKQNQIIDYISRNVVNYSGMELAIARMKMCLGQLQYLKEKVEDNNILKINILKSIIENIEYLSSKHSYINGTNAQGRNTFAVYKSTDITSYKLAKEAAIQEINKIAPSLAKKYEEIEKKRKYEQKIKEITIISVAVIIFFAIVIGSLLTPTINKRAAYFGKWKSENMSIELKDDYTATITQEDNIEHSYKYETNCYGNFNQCEILIMDNNEIKYTIDYSRKWDEYHQQEETFCVKEINDCTIQFTKE